MKTYDELFDDLQARIQRDAFEISAWRDQQMFQIDHQQRQDSDRLRTAGVGVSRLYDNQRRNIEAQYQSKIEKAQAHHEKLQTDLNAGKISHIWIEAEKEKHYGQAKKIWDREVEEAHETRRRPPSKEVYDRFRKMYGEDILRELVESTQREMDQREKVEQQTQQERAARTAAFQAEEKQRQQILEQQRQEKLNQQRKHNTDRLNQRFSQDAYQMTGKTDRDWKQRVDDLKAQELRMRQKLERAAPEENLMGRRVETDGHDQKYRQIREQIEQTEQQKTSDLDRFQKTRQAYEQNKDLSQDQGY